MTSLESHFLYASPSLTLHSLSLFSFYRQRSLLLQSVFTEVIQLCNVGVTLDIH